MTVGGHPFRDPPARKLPSARIKPRVSRSAKFVAIGVFAVIWNVASTWQLMLAVQLGPASAIVFVSFFVFLGLVLLVVAVHALLSIFNPTVELLVDERPPAIGDTLELGWRVIGRSSRVKAIRIFLEGSEEVSYTNGTSTETEKHTFARIEVASATDPTEIAEGTGRLVIPPGLAPTFTAKHNKIVWRLVVAGEIRRWPDIDDEFPVEVTA